MMNDRVIYFLLYQFIVECVQEGDDIEWIRDNPSDTWESFWVESSKLKGRYEEIKHLIVAIAKEIDRKDKLKCQYCRIDEGFLVEPPVKAEDLCKKHRQEYEEQYVDRTKLQKHPGIGDFVGKEGLHCSAPMRKK